MSDEHSAILIHNRVGEITTFRNMSSVYNFICFNVTGFALMRNPDVNCVEAIASWLFTVALNVVIPISFLDKYYKFFGVNRGKHDDFWGKHRVKQICSFGSFFDVNCTNCLNATQL